MSAIRSYLYVPGDRPDLLEKARSSAAHALILDLEDGVAPPGKAEARRHVLAALTEPPSSPTFVRVDPDALDADLTVAVEGRAVGIVLAKATAETVAAASAALDRIEDDHGVAPLTITALVESARGLLDAAAVAGHPRVEGLAIGEADLRAELGVEPGPDQLEMAPFRSTIVVASAAAGIRRATGPAGTDFRDLDRFRTSCEQLRRQGFGARSAIHPAQVEVINEVFAPSAAEVERARELVAAFDAGVAGGRAIQLGDDGGMLDEAVIRSARRLLDGL